MKAKSGFTLVEILIVVVILGILAAIVIPQFTNASVEAKVSSVVSDLQTMRSQIELYKIQHNEELPDMTSQATFEADMLEKTDVDGAAWVEGTSTGTSYGPYLQKIPTNPFNDSDLINFSDTAANGSTYGWRMDSDGKFYADDGFDGDDDGTPDHEQYEY